MNANFRLWRWMFHFRPLHPLIDFMTTMFEYYLSYLMYYFERIRCPNMSKKVRVPNWRRVVVNDPRYEVFSCSTSQIGKCVQIQISVKLAKLAKCRIGVLLQAARTNYICSGSTRLQQRTTALILLFPLGNVRVSPSTTHNSPYGKDLQQS